MDEATATSAFAEWWATHGWAFDLAVLGFIVSATFSAHKRNMRFMHTFFPTVRDLRADLSSTQQVVLQLHERVVELEKRLQGD